MNGRVVLADNIGQLRVESHPIPKIGSHDVLLRITEASICGSDLHLVRQRRLTQSGEDPSIIMGHEGTGIVLELGSNVSRDSSGTPVKEGDGIAFFPAVPCGRCKNCRRENVHWCENRLSKDVSHTAKMIGTFADFLVLQPRQSFYKITPDMRSSRVAPLNCAVGTGVHAVSGRLTDNDDVVAVVGCGVVGLSAIAYAASKGRQVIAFDKAESRLEMASRFGAASALVASDPKGISEVLLDVTSGRGADLLIEAVGSPAIVPDLMRSVASGGTLVEVGVIIPGMPQLLDFSLFHTPRTISGARLYPPSLLPKLIDFVHRHPELPFAELVERIYPLDDCDDALEEALAGKSLRVGLVPGNSSLS